MPEKEICAKSPLESTETSFLAYDPFVVSWPRMEVSEYHHHHTVVETHPNEVAVPDDIDDSMENILDESTLHQQQQQQLLHD